MTAERIRRIMLVLSVVGLGIAGYLTYVHYRGIKVLCVAGGGGCEQVQASSYSKLGGVPVALLGLIGYVAILISLLFRDERARLATVVLTLGGFAFSLYLTYRELFTIDAICQWCVASAVVITVLAVLSVLLYLRADQEVATQRH